MLEADSSLGGVRTNGKVDMEFPRSREGTYEGTKIVRSNLITFEK